MGAAGHGHAHSHPSSPRRALGAALTLTALFSVVEVVVGLWSGSLALLADAGHMIGDSAALTLSLVVSVIASRPRSRSKTYGYRRAEVLGALINAVGLLVVAFFIVREAVERVQHPPAVRGLGMLGTAIGGLAVNLLAAWILARRGGAGINVRGALMHVLGDALGSVAAIVAGVLLVVAGWRIADPIASIVISVLILYGALRLLRETTHVLMEGTPAGLDCAALEATILATPGVSALHDLHVWALTPGEPMLTAHVVIDAGAHGTVVAQKVGDRVREAHGIEHVTIQPEPPPAELVVLRLPPDRQAQS